MIFFHKGINCVILFVDATCKITNKEFDQEKYLVGVSLHSKIPIHHCDMHLLRTDVCHNRCFARLSLPLSICFYYG